MSHPARTAETVAVLEETIADYAGTLAPAVSVAAFDATGVIAWHGVGEPRLDGAPVTRETVFRIASMSKSFLAATALALDEAGALDLAAPVARYLPGVRFTYRGIDYPVTVAELLSNRSGMPEDNAWADRQLGSSREYIAGLFAEGIGLTQAPGVGYQYSNLGMSLVGRVIEAAVGRSVEAEITSRFIEPLGLTGTRFAVEHYGEGTDVAHGFRTFDTGATFIQEPFIGEGALACIGGLFSTVDDIATWSWFLASGYTNEPLAPELLSARSRIEMQRVHTPIPVPAATEFRDLTALGYGLGLFPAHDRRLGATVDHSGGLPGFSSNMRWHTDSGVGVVVFGNSDAFRADTLAMAAHAGVLRAKAVPPRTVEPWPLALEAGALLDGLIRGGEPLAGAAHLTSSNFFADVPDEVRTARVAELLQTVGEPRERTSFGERIVGASDAAHLRWRIDCAHGALVCDIRLIGLSAPLVQSLTVAIADETGTKPLAGEPGLQVLAAVAREGSPVS
ncbi:serine hydrolase domain-containing protein [Leucobacter aridicollis]|uniref:CubicO group peptidase (Beta-lactamase class C family) n=1 Tax=Leucobacter aridicollis TaxID=283878 RepID=A0A852RLJ0_9MICO|nr:serine hydrolase domain-containing protein [Leucobacter aridicollis]NYD27532.1 CubicO group peptidase (beta-lactamase class C family) [Leucobacter aridicollis]